MLLSGRLSSAVVGCPLDAIFVKCLGRQVAHAFVAVDAGRVALEHWLVDGSRRFLLLREHLGSDDCANG